MASVPYRYKGKAVDWLILIVIIVGAIALYRSGRINLATARVECPICKEAIEPHALACPRCRADLGQGLASRRMRAMQEDLLERYRSQRRRDQRLLAVLLVIILAVAFYIWRATLQPARVLELPGKP